MIPENRPEDVAEDEFRDSLAELLTRFGFDTSSFDADMNDKIDRTFDMHADGLWDIVQRYRSEVEPDAPTGTCCHCERAIVHDSQDGWIDPEATGDDSVWRETCDAHDTFEARHEPVDA